jgi:hypothetical protein
VLEQVFIQCTVGGPVRVYVKDGVITRMRPMVFYHKVDAPSWVIEARGKKFRPASNPPFGCPGSRYQERRHRQALQRPRPGTGHSYEAVAKYDPLEPGVAGSPDRGGCVDLLSPSPIVSKKVPGEAQNSRLVEIAKWEA